MDIFHVLTMLGGLCLFLFGMNFMGQSLERRAGGKLRTLLDKMTGSVGAGFLTGMGITAIIQPGGSKRDDESIQACNEHGIAMVFTGERHFKH